MDLHKLKTFRTVGGLLTFNRAAAVLNCAQSTISAHIKSIEIDIPHQKLRVDISEAELQSRMDAWTPPESSVKKGWLSIYAKMAKAADQGAALRYE